MSESIFAVAGFPGTNLAVANNDSIPDIVATSAAEAFEIFGTTARTDRVIFETSENVTFDLGVAAIEIARGGRGDDVLYTTADFSTGNTSVWMSGHEGNDQLFGGSDDDSLFGAEGNDTLVGGAGRDRLDGGSGRDIAYFNSSPEGIDVDLTRAYARLLSDGSVEFSQGLDPRQGGAGSHAEGDIILFVEDIYGSEKSDKIRGDAEANTFYGVGGNDYLAGGAGADTLFGGNGRDVLNGYDDNEVDQLDGQDGGDEYYLGRGDIARDTGSDPNDYDYYYTSSGAIIQESDDNWGSTRWWYSARTEPLPDGALRSSNEMASVTVEIDPNIERAGKTVTDDVRDGFASLTITETGVLSVAYSDANFGFYDFNWNGGDIHLDAGREAVSRVGTDGNDEMGGTSRADLIIGGAGDDTIEGGSHNDELSGELGDDQLAGGSGSDALYGDRGNDKLDGGSGDDRLWGGSDDDRLSGGSGNDMLSGNAGDDRLRGDAGHDRILGGAGLDWLTGDNGRDTFVYHAGDGADIVTDFYAHRRGANADIIEISDDVTGFDVFADILAAASQVGANTVIDFGSGDTLTLQGVQISALNASDFAFM